MTKNKNSLKDESIKLLVISMSDKLSGRKIGKALGISARAVQEFLAKDTFKSWWDSFESNSKHKTIGVVIEGEYSDTKTIPTIRGEDSNQDNRRILVIPDLHIPFHHPDSLEFLQHLKDKYEPTRVICLGDETDGHALSYHEKETDGMSAYDELQQVLPVIKELERMFPVVDLLDSNHGSLAFRKAKTAGIPKHYLKTYQSVLQVGEGWKWWFDMTVTLPNGNRCYFHHGKSNNVVKTSQAMSMCAVQGHYHNGFKIEYWANPNGIYWGLQSGCLIDDKVYAFNYNNCNLTRPLIGASVIIDSIPMLEPMILDQTGRWKDRTK